MLALEEMKMVPHPEVDEYKEGFFVSEKARSGRQIPIIIIIVYYGHGLRP